MKNKGYLVILTVFWMLLLTTVFCFAGESEEPLLKFDNLNTTYREDLTGDFGEDLTAQSKALMGSIADMFKMKTWIYELKGAATGEDLKEYVDTVLESYPWPDDVQKIKLQEDEFGRSIESLVESYEDEFNQIWGNDWSARAKKAARKYEEREILSKSYIFSDDTGKTASITVTSPFGSLRTFELYEGVYIIITQMSINL